MSELAVDQPAGDKQRDYQRGTQDKSQQVIPDACSFHVSMQERHSCLSYLLFLKTPDVRNERVDFLSRKFFPIGGHLVLAIRDGIEDSLVANSVLPLRIAKIARVFEFALKSFGASVAAV